MTSKTARPFLAIAGFALVACGGEPSGEAPEADASPTVTPAPAPAATAPTPAPSTAAIPARFIGVWDEEQGSCNPASELMLRIAPDGIGFYESHGTVISVTEAPDGEATLDLAMEGEGDTWRMSMTFRLTGQGADERLVVPYEDNAGKLVPLRFKRCPA
ncbi:MAG: hypothetical protein H2049_03520 [Porphyrobacter sp.]|nr:hypothetical protein [Porphyrobacter sp.]